MGPGLAQRAVAAGEISALVDGAIRRSLRPAPHRARTPHHPSRGGVPPALFALDEPGRGEPPPDVGPGPRVLRRSVAALPVRRTRELHPGILRSPLLELAGAHG